MVVVVLLFVLCIELLVRRDGCGRELDLSIRRRRQMCISVSVLEKETIPFCWAICSASLQRPPVHQPYRSYFLRYCLVVVVPVSSAVGHTPVSYIHLRAHETPEHLVRRLLLEKINNPPH